MISLQLEKIGSLKLKKKPVPEANPGEILLKVSHCALCRTDAKMWERGQRDLVLPRILGHEICGFSETSGKRFVVWPGKACGYCKQCKAGAENLCREMQIMGFHKDGGLAEYAAVPESSLIPIPDDLPGDIASLAEPLACTINAIQQAKVKTEDRVLIFGAGPVGLLMGLAVHTQEAYPFIRDINPDRFIQSEKFCNKIGIQCDSEQSESGFDAVINAASSTDTFLNGIPELNDAGCFCLFSGLTDNNPIPASLINEIHYRQLTITGAYGCTGLQMEKAVKILSDNKNKVKLLIEAHIRLENVSPVLPGIAAGQALKYIVEF
ncbi:MAG: alcohol dehydrogenase catalytic domain-containing protein [Desulfobacteraceae bacterium]|nr:alcohol dehydrogenase catalytic domain-containing protein [Desulfobacteraceae bacterium]